MDENTLYQIGGNAPADVEIKKEYSFFESVIALGLVVISFVLIRLGNIVFMSNITVLFCLGVMAADITYISFRHHKIKPVHCVLFGLIILFNFAFLVSSSSDIRLLASLFSTLLLMYTVFIIICDRKPFFTDEVPQEMLETVFKQPFKNFTEWGSAVKYPLKKNNAANVIKNVVVGLVIAVPCTFVIGSLLMNADNMFFDIIVTILPADIEEFIVILIQIGLSVPIACYFFGLLKTDDKIPQINPVHTKKGISAITLYTAVTPICILYVIFFFVSIKYFTSAFTGVLPSGYTYSEYARQGFFELFAVSVINLCIIIGLNIFCSRNDGKKPKGILFYTVFIIISTMTLIVTALSKMILYISVNGLTHLRVYTSWFMVLLFMFLVIILIKTFNVKFKMFLTMFVTFVVMLGGLCFSNIDYRIADYNIKGYLNGSIEKFDCYYIFYDLSNSAIAAAIPYADNEIIGGQITSAIDKCRYSERDIGFFDDDFYSFSFESHKAYKAFREYVETHEKSE